MAKQMKITCKKHTDFVLPPSGYCRKCVDEMNLAMQVRHPQGGVTYSYDGPNTVLLDGVKTPRMHATEYLEYEVPSVLCKKFEKEIARQIKEYERTCMCLRCQFDRVVKPK